MNNLTELIYKDLLNIVDDEAKIILIRHNWTDIINIQNPSEPVQLEAVKINGNAISYIEKPSNIVQLESIKQLKDCWNFMINAYYLLDCPKALNLLYKKAPEYFKERIKSHPNYKTDAQLILESIGDAK